MAKKPKMTVYDAVNKILSAGLSVIEHENNSDSSVGTTHMSIVGGVRIVEFYPSTLTGYSNQVNGKFKQAKVTGIEAAIKLAKTGVN